MSDQYLYECPQCGYSIYTDDQGCECTFTAIAYLYFCEDCHILAQRVTPALFIDGEVEDIKWYCEGRDITPFRLGFCESSEYKVVKDDKRALNNVHCPICGSHNIHKWNPIFGGCPNCGVKMIKNEGICINTD